MSLWYTDRSRYSTGTGRCGRERYLTYHGGPNGYGIVRKGESLPLATGSFVHVALEHCFEDMRRHDRLPTVEEVRAAIAWATLAYIKKIEARGFRGLLQSERSEYIVAEQCALLSGLVWAAYKTVLPWIISEYRILEVETETTYILDCTCGLGSAVMDAAAHDARDCNGIAQQLRQDVIAQKRNGQGLAYFESKTTGWAGDNWASQWETKPQLTIGSFGIKERYGRDISETFILGFYKGPRKSRGEGDDQIKIQDSPFCYGYLKPGNPPLATDDWAPSYQWTDSYGLTKRASRQHQKAPLWIDFAKTDWPGYSDKSIDPVEFWVNQVLPEEILKKQVFLLGPMNKQEAQDLQLREQIVGEERQWQDILWKLYEQQTITGRGWSDPDFMFQLDRLVPASWDCRRFGAGSECQHAGICFRREGWEDPLQHGWVPRRPHHQSELDQAIGRGLLAEAEEGEEDEHGD